MSFINILQLKTTRNTPAVEQVRFNVHRNDGESMPWGTVVLESERVLGAIGLVFWLSDLGEGLRKWDFILD